VDYAGRPPADKGGRDCLGLRALHRFYACADGWLALVCDTEEEASGLARALALDLHPAQALAAPRDGDLARALETAFAVRSREEALDALTAAGVPAAPALRAAEALTDPYLIENRLLEMWDHPRLGAILGVRGFSDFSRTPTGFRRPCPDLGEHTAELLAEFGVSPDRIEALFATGAVFEPGHVGHTLAKSARLGNDSAALAVQ
jgi:crotonobetainyl-CoA:carnitine CoA-transferase CaiB-like acyl-CoA transferase